MQAIILKFLLDQYIPPKKYHGFHKNIKQHMVFNIENNKKCYLTNWPSNQHIIIISEGSCDSENWSNDDENDAQKH